MKRRLKGSSDLLVVTLSRACSWDRLRVEILSMRLSFHDTESWKSLLSTLMEFIKVFRALKEGLVGYDWSENSWSRNTFIKKRMLKVLESKF